VCGSQNGVLNVFEWGDWDDIVERFPGHPQSVDALVAIDDDTLVTGSSDGLLR
jgi:WD repeat-containing protein 55